MKKWSLVLAAVTIAAAAQAETISVPCSEFVAATGEPVSCQAIPNIQIDSADYAAKKAAHAQGAPSAANSPWAGNAQQPLAEEAQQAPNAEDCKMPIWMRPEGCPKN